MFHQSISVMESYLKDTLDATDEELTYLQEIIDLRLKKLKSSTANQRNCSLKTSSKKDRSI